MPVVTTALRRVFSGAALHRTTPAVVVAALLLTAPPSDAARHVVYDVELEGSYGYAIATDHREKGFRRTTEAQAKGTFASTAGQFSFVDGGLDERPGGRPLTDLRVDYTSSGSLSEKTTSEFGGNTMRSCTVSGEPVTANGWVRDDLLQYLTPGAPVNMEVRIASAVHVPFEASADCPAGTGIDFGTMKGADELGRMDAKFELPIEAIGPGKTIQLVKGPKWEGCPGAGAPEVTACSFSWQGTITFTKVLDEELGPDGQPIPKATPAPVPPGPFIGSKPGPVPVPGPVAAPVTDTPEAPTAPTVPGDRAKVGAAAASVSFGAACPAGCSGKATVSAGTGGRAVRRTLAFSLKPSPATKTVKLALPKPLRAALRREGRGRIDVSVTPKTGGATLKKTLPLKVGR